MSDTWMTFIPTEREYVPSQDAQARASELLRSFLPDADEVKTEASEQISFFNGYGNWMGVACPECGADLENWFGDALSAAYDRSGCRDLSVVAPCCNKQTSIDQLKYGWPAGFSRFSMRARNPNSLDAELTPAQHQALEQALGCSLKVIWEHI
jgi:hypothetical protein